MQSLSEQMKTYILLVFSFLHTVYCLLVKDFYNKCILCICCVLYRPIRNRHIRWWGQWSWWWYCRGKRWSSTPGSRIRLSSLSQTKAHSHRLLADPTRPTRGSLWQQPVRRRTRTQGPCRQPQPHWNTGISDAIWHSNATDFPSDFALWYAIPNRICFS